MTPPQISPDATGGAKVHHQRAWWRFPIMWLIVGGPAIVVVAAISTAVIAVRGADPVLMRDESGGASQVREGAESMTPALQARNHAATPKP
jgi:hypothetical protein